MIKIMTYRTGAGACSCRVPRALASPVETICTPSHSLALYRLVFFAHSPPTYALRKYFTRIPSTTP